MRVHTLLVIVFMLACAGMKAQTTFTQRLEQQIDGQGTIEIDQDSRLTDIVNGITVVASTVTTSKPTSLATEMKARQDPEDLKTRTSGVHQKVRGYRVQVYFGGNSRSDQTQAQKTGSRVASQFPELRTYTSFVSPHWRCRVGDFTKREDANTYMRKLKARGFSEAVVVASEIYISRELMKR